jgi:hypothetical protein
MSKQFIVSSPILLIDFRHSHTPRQKGQTQWAGQGNNAFITIKMSTSDGKKKEPF